MQLTMATTVFLSLLSFLKFTGPSEETKEWERHSMALRALLAPLHQEIARANTNFPEYIETLGNTLTEVIREYFVVNCDFFVDEASNHSSNKFVTHKNHTITQLEGLKKTLRKEAFGPTGSEDKRKEFYQCIQAISELKKREKKKQEAKTTLFHEKQFNKNKYKYSKDIVTGTFGSESAPPSCDKATADNFYTSTYSVHREIDFTQLHWFPHLPTSPENEAFTPFNTEPFKPRDIRSTLKKSNKKSAPGPCGITYNTLLKLESTHHILATYFNKVFMSGAHPPSWGESVVKPIHKKGDTSVLSNFRMIALSGCIGKLYHLLLAERLTTFLTLNKLIDPSLQKAFLPGINGCIEHNIVMDEIIKDAKSNSKTCHITFFDLEDAFGSVPHSLIQHTLERNFIPPVIRKYFHNMYKHSTAVVETKAWRSDPFKFKRGVFQGDPISPVIFLLEFNPILQNLQNNSDKGYKVGGAPIVTLPYADDFCLITTHKTTHKNLINSINTQVTSMGMKLKPSKCRSFSLTSGKPEAIKFKIGEHEVPSIRDEEQKFLGKLQFFKGKSEEVFNHIQGIFREGLENIEKAMVRNEYKLWMYANYLLPSKRFLLTINTLTDTHLKLLDTLTDKFIKKWAGLPPSATNAIIHMKEGLDVKSISELYTETHAVSHTRTRLKGDTTVNAVMDATLERESDFTRKKSTCTEAESSFKAAIQAHTVSDENNEGHIPNFTGEQAASLKHNFDCKVSESVKSVVRAESRHKWENHVKQLAVQGKFLALAAAEKEDVVWKSYMFDLKQGTLKFLLNASIDTLPTAANLKRWKKSSSDLCKLCKRRQTTSHILNACKVSLDTGRYTWRHNCIVNYIVNSCDEKFTVYSDLPGHTAPGGGSIPPELCVTVQKPDIVIIDKHKKSIHLFELTCPLEEHIDTRHMEKSNKYAHFVTDIAQYQCTVNAFEVSSKGFISSRNHGTLATLHSFMKPTVKLTHFKKNISALSLTASHQIFICRNDPTFMEPPFLLPPLDRGRARGPG